ncbi:troponin I-like [Papaver somniferum]|uniref:troponin I-like n=1 Tax=Papaver somniferum TaxID=3469 RepID=UPI000E702341|nr:troponin I-like [Papaver somniferum]
MTRTPDQAAHMIETRRSKRLEAKRGGRTERGVTSAAGERQGVNQRRTEKADEDNFREGSVHTSDTEPVAGKEMTREEMQENIGEEDMTLEQLLERRRYEERQGREENERRREDERHREFNRKDEEERRRGEGRFSVMRGDRWERNGGNLNQDVLNDLRDMRVLINNSRGGSRVQLAKAIEEADKSSFTYEIMYSDIPEKCVLPTLPSIFSGSESAVQHLKQYTLSLMQWG